MTTTRHGPGARQNRRAPAPPTLWSVDRCDGGCPRHHRPTDVVTVVDLVTGLPVHLCPRCLWRQLSRQLNRSAGAGGIWDLAVCEDHPPEKVPTLPHDGRLVCSDCLTGSGGLLGPPLSSSW